MKFSREIEHAALAAISTTLTGKTFEQEDSDTHQKTTYRIVEVGADSYESAPCLVARCEPEGEDGEVYLLIRADFLDDC